MLKWIFAILVLANVALYMWGRWYHQPLTAIESERPPPDVAAGKMKLLSEPGAHLIPRATRPAPADATGAAGASESTCYKLGKFDSLEQARAAGRKLDAWGLDYTRLDEFETLGPSYRVYLPPLASREAAERKLRELTRLGFTDHAIIQGEADMENAISLGIFSVEKNALARVHQLARKNVKARVQPIPNTHPVYWLALAAPAIDGRIGTVPTAQFAKQDWGASGVGLHPAACGTGHAAQLN